MAAMAVNTVIPFLASVVVLLSLGAASDPQQSITLDRIGVKGQWLVDKFGRIRLFHGVNSVLKQPPWYDAQILNETRLKYFKEWGFNAVRLGTMWTGVEPSRGAYNQSYLNVMKAAVSSLEKYGMYALLDMHQDQGSTFYNSYDGIPRWLIAAFDPPLFKFPWPFKKVGYSDFRAYLTEACGKGFQDLYDNKKGALDAWTGFWVKVAQTFKDISSVLGYEFINEPWAGNIYVDPALLLPGHAGRKNLLPAYNRINAAIRNVDNHTLVFYEPVTWGVWLNGTTLGTGFDTVPGGPEYESLSVLSWHYYCWLIQSGSAEGRPYPTLERFVCDEIQGKDVFKQVVADTLRIGGASFMTEFGICEPNKIANSTGNIECGFIMKQADEHLQSWTYWDLNVFFTPGGHVNWTGATPFARPYTRAVAGTPKRMTFNPDDLSFEFDYIVDMNIHAPTEIFIPPVKYPKGVTVNVTEGLGYTFDSGNHVVLVTAKQATVIASIRIAPKM
ncbi:endoglycoceramidase-like [Lineus longissimus]|uniref:endoglycoceramidase-like n=1 Tax=Lineus longissimus TaxID=88925 RepID=UPI002B4D689F